jgi:MinD superfamily P-loop ATPase
VDYALIVTEPTVSAIHDMERLVELTQHFGIKAGICINKYDINLKLCDTIDRFSKNKKMKVLSRIPYDVGVTKAQIEGVPYLEYTKNGISKNIHRLWENLKQEIITPDKKANKKNKKLIQLDELH